MGATDSPIVAVRLGDVLTFEADVLAVKYAQAFFGADREVMNALAENGVTLRTQMPKLPAPGDHALIEPMGAIQARRILLLGVPPLGQFNYPQIEQFAADVLRILASEAPTTRHIALTLHGPGYGLDEIEALDAELRGIIGSAQKGDIPRNLQQISIVERDRQRVDRLQAALGEASRRWTLPQTTPNIETQTLSISGLSHAQSRLVSESSREADNKPRVFVAMPFSRDWEDTYYYGIQKPVRDLGFVCERVDQESFTGDILDQVKDRIEKADIVIAELTGANPNVYLEVGFAWGKRRPTLLLVKDPKELRFDVQGQRCLAYGQIKELEKRLLDELPKLLKK